MRTLRKLAIPSASPPYKSRLAAPKDTAKCLFSFLNRDLPLDFIGRGRHEDAAQARYSVGFASLQISASSSKKTL